MGNFFDLKNKVAIITGSSRGIGKGIALRYSELGAKIIVSSRKIDVCKQVVKEIVDSGGTASAYECNISNKDACEGLIKFAKEKYGKLDVLICNAASNRYYGKLAEIPDESFDKIMNNNVKSNLWLCKSAIPHLKDNQNGSSIIIISYFKSELKDVVINLIEPISSRIQDSKNDKTLLINTLKLGSDKAREIATKTISDVDNLMGLNIE